MSDVLPIARGLEDLAAPSTKETLAEHLNMGVGGGAFKTKFATTQYYGLVEAANGDLYRLTRIGAATLTDGANSVAGRAAVMTSGFGSVLRTLKTRMVQTNVVAARLKADQGVVADQAERVAEVLIETARETGLIKDNKFGASAMDTADDFAKEESDETEQGDEEEVSAEEQNGAGESEFEKPPADPTPIVRPATPEQIIINVDASKMSAQDLAELIQELRKWDSSPS